jgi:hypothetical protein
MEQKEVVIGNKKFIVKELLGVEFDKIDFSNKLESIKQQVTLSAGIQEDEYNKLTLKERLAILKAIEEVNGLTDFR